jgi:hypothetical protein
MQWQPVGRTNNWDDTETKKVRLHVCADSYQHKTGDMQHMKMLPNGQVLAAPRCVKMIRIIMYSELQKMWKTTSVAKLKALQVPWHFACRDCRKTQNLTQTLVLAGIQTECPANAS